MRTAAPLAVTEPLGPEDARLAEEGYVRALRAAYPAKIAQIQQLWQGGQRRRALIPRFGQDLVDLAIADLVG